LHANFGGYITGRFQDTDLSGEINITLKKKIGNNLSGA
jgi:hypothetical protein